MPPLKTPINVTAFPSEPISSPSEQLRDQMRGAGIEPPQVFVWNGQIHRFPTKDGHDDAGWYVLFDDNVPAGAFGDWRLGSSNQFVANIGRPLSFMENQENRKRIDEARKRHDEERKFKNERAAETCEEIWASSSPASPDHPYLKRKGIGVHLARIAPDGRLVIPLFDSDGTLSTVQYIDHEGTKLYHKGGATKGRFATLGAIGKKAYVVEGFATGATVYEVTGIPTAIAFSAGNLEPVVGRLKAKHPELEIIIVADNDASGIGRNHAEQAAAKHGATVVMPPSPGDANDYRALGGDLMALLTPNLDVIHRMQVIFGNDLGDNYEAPNEVIQDIVVANSLAVLYGDSNSGKTFFALSLATAVAEGMEAYGKKVDPGLVVYLATEAPGSIRSRMQALKRYHGKSLSNLAMVPVPLNFYSNAGDASSVVALIEQIEQVRGQKVKLVIADTLARMSAGANENSGEDMGPVMERFSMVVQHTGVAMVIIHHTGKDAARGARGWSGIRAHIETEIEVTEKDGIRSATLTKQRELSSKGQEIFFDLAVIPMGISKFGAEVSTCVAVVSGQGTIMHKLNTLTKTHLSWLQEMLIRNGNQTLDGFPFVSREDVKTYLTTVQNLTDSTATKSLQPGASNYWAGNLMKEDYLQTQGNGFVVTNPAFQPPIIINIKRAR